MRWVRVVPVVGAVVVLGVAAVGYEKYIPIHHVDRALLSRLVVARPPTGLVVKPIDAAEVPASSNPFTAFKSAAKRSPNSTGSYSVDWSATGSSSDGASLLVSLFPSEADAVAAEAQAMKTYLTSGGFKSNGYVLAGRFSVPSLPGSGAAAFKSTAAKSDSHLAAVTFRLDRVVVIESVQESSAAPAQAVATSLAQTESAHLRQLGSGFSLKFTTRPLAASLIYGAVAIGIGIVIVSTPPLVSRNRRRRLRAQEAAAQRELRSRGRKIARHQAARRRR